jgi:hypothetical protein
MMEEIDSGGTAFPCPEDASWARQHGMSMRDYFAAKALQGLLAAPDAEGRPKLVAAYAYEFADAMVAISTRTR